MRKGSGQIRYKTLCRHNQNPACQSDCSASHLKRDVSKTLSCSIKKPTFEIVTAAKLAPAGLGCSQLKHKQLLPAEDVVVYRFHWVQKSARNSAHRKRLIVVVMSHLRCSKCSLYSTSRVHISSVIIALRLHNFLYLIGQTLSSLQKGVAPNYLSDKYSV